MARKRLYKHAYTLGYNTRDNPTSVPFESGQILENLLPNNPNPIPRNGSEQWGNSETQWAADDVLRAMIPYETTSGKVLILISKDSVNDYVYLKKESAAQPLVLIASGAYNLWNPDMTWVRIGDDIYLSNAVDQVYILENQGAIDDFIFRKANITRPTPGVSPNITVTPIAGGDITEDTYVNFAVTYVRRTDPDGVDGAGDPIRNEWDSDQTGFNPGVLESVDDLDQRAVREFTVANKTARITAWNLDQLDSDESVTHVRFYRSLEFATEVEAQGATMRWIGDFPVAGPNSEVVGGNYLTYDHTKDNDTYAGNFNFNKMVGFDSMPAGKTMMYHNGRIWLGGITFSGGKELRGRYFYSVPPRDVDYPQKWYSMFLTGTQALEIRDPVTETSIFITGWKDTDHEDDEFCEIVDVSRNDIIFVNSKSIWFLADGDPETFEPELMDRVNGTKFHNSMVHIDDSLYYLSNNGPAVIQGRLVTLINDHTAGEVWPNLYDGSRGYFFDSYANPALVKGYYFRENWFLADDTVAVALHMPNNKRGFGPWKFVPATEAEDTLKFGFGVTFGDEVFIVYPFITDDQPTYEVLKEGVYNDFGNDFTLHGKGKSHYMSDRDREMYGELAQLLMFVEFADSEILHLIIHSDFDRIEADYQYEQYTSDHILQAQEVVNTFRLNILQPILEGFIGQIFEFEWHKVHASPYRFITKGYTMEAIIRHGKTSEFMSIGQETGDIIETGVAAIEIIESGSQVEEVIEGGYGS